MLLISKPEIAEHTVTLRLEGRLVGPWVDELRRACEQFQGNGHRLMLDVTDVIFADPTGVALLARLRASAIEFIGCSPFLQEQMKRAD